MRSRFLSYSAIAVLFTVNAVSVVVSVTRAQPQMKATLGIVGEWQGLFVRGPLRLRVIVHVTETSSGQFAATMDSPDQGNATGIPLSAVTFANGKLHFEFMPAHIAYTGVIAADGSELVGIWDQGGPSYLVFARQGVEFSAVAPLKRGSVTMAPCNFPSLTRQARCGTYEVFEDRKTRTGRKISLSLLMLPATETSSPDPVFFIAGGPGQSAIEVIKTGNFLAAANRHHDLVFVDQRGTGGSNPLTCALPGDPQALSTYLTERLQPDAIKACRTELETRADLKLYTTQIAMDDLNEVRTAMGYAKIDLLGGSYGTTAAMSYLRQHPASVRAVALNGVAPVEAKLPLPFAAGVENALNHVFASCATDVNCQKAYPDLRAEFVAVVDRFKGGPVTVKALDPVTAAKVDLPVSRELFMECIRLLLYSPGTVRLLPLMIHQMKTDDFTTFVGVSYQLLQQLSASLALGMQLSVICAEDTPFVTDDQAAAQMKNTFYGEGRVMTVRKACGQWPRGEVSATFNDPIRSDVPILMLSGEADPATPSGLGAAAMKTLTNARQLLIRNGTHLTSDPCLWDLIGRFFDEGTAKSLDSTCLDGIKWMPFVIGT